MTLAINLTGAFDYHSGGATELFPFPRAAVEYPFTTEWGNPSLLPAVPGLRASLSCGRPYTGSEIEIADAWASISNGWLASALGWHLFGTDFHRESRLSLSAALMTGRFLSMGMEGSLYSLSIRDENNSIKENRRGLSLSVSSSPHEMITLAAMKTNILRFPKEDELLLSQNCFGITFRPNRLLALSWNLNYHDEERINSFSASARPLKNLIIRAGYSPETYTFASSLSVLLSNISIDYALSHHTFLGYSHRLGMTFSSQGFGDYAMVDTKKKAIKKRVPKRMININQAKQGELMELPGMTEVLARRIIIYRKKFGPVSIKILGRIGFTDKQIHEMTPHIFGLEKGHSHRGKKKNFSKKNWLKSKKAAVKKLFMKLVKREVRPSRAMKYAEVYVWNRGKLSRLLREDRELTKKERKVIKQICLRK